MQLTESLSCIICVHKHCVTSGHVCVALAEVRRQYNLYLFGSYWPFDLLSNKHDLSSVIHTEYISGRKEVP